MNTSDFLTHFFIGLNIFLNLEFWCMLYLVNHQKFPSEIGHHSNFALLFSRFWVLYKFVISRFWISLSLHLFMYLQRWPPCVLRPSGVVFSRRPSLLHVLASEYFRGCIESSTCPNLKLIGIPHSVERASRSSFTKRHVSEPCFVWCGQWLMVLHLIVVLDQNKLIFKEMLTCSICVVTNRCVSIMCITSWFMRLWIFWIWSKKEI